MADWAAAIASAAGASPQAPAWLTLPVIRAPMSTRTATASRTKRVCISLQITDRLAAQHKHEVWFVKARTACFIKELQ
jgi:hypothetical protein